MALPATTVELVVARRGCGLQPPVSDPDRENPPNESLVAAVISPEGVITQLLLDDEARKRRSEVIASGGRLLESDLLLPGFVDIHTHGLGGADDALNNWTNPGFTQEYLPRLGTTSFLASIVFPNDETTVNAVTSQLVPRIGAHGHGAILEGIHAEGPLVHDLGALPDSGDPVTLEQLDAWIESLPERAVRMMTISPRVEATVDYVRLKCLLKHSILPALGHDRVASEADILGALRCCPERRLHITHLFNVSNFHHRLPSLVNFGLLEEFPNLPQYSGLLPPTVEVIGDLAHVHPMTIKATLSCRHTRNVAFVSDAMSIPEPGRTMTYAGRHLVVGADGIGVKLAGTDTLAGSCASLLTTFKNLVRVLGMSEEQASTMLSTTPARIVGLDHIGSLTPGCRADMVLLNDSYDLQHTVIGGKVVYSRPAATLA